MRRDRDTNLKCFQPTKNSPVIQKERIKKEKEKGGNVLAGKQLPRGTFPHGISREVLAPRLPVVPLYNLHLFKRKQDWIKTLQ